MNKRYYIQLGGLVIAASGMVGDLVLEKSVKHFLDIVIDLIVTWY